MTSATEDTFADNIAQYLGIEYSSLVLLEEPEIYDLYYGLIKQVATFRLKKAKLGEVRLSGEKARHLYDLNKFFVEFIGKSDSNRQKKITKEINQFLGDKKFRNHHYWRKIGNEDVSNSLKPEQAEALFCCAAKIEKKNLKLYLREFFIYCEDHDLDIVCLEEYAKVISRLTQESAKISKSKNVRWWSSSLFVIPSTLLVTFTAYYISNFIKDDELKCINELTATLNSSSEQKPPINFSECKSIIFDELKSPKHTADYDYIKKYNLISNIIDSARAEENTGFADLSDLYLYRALYSVDMNLSQYIDDLKSAHALNKFSLPAAELLRLLDHDYGHESFKSYVAEDSYWVDERFPWKNVKSFVGHLPSQNSKTEEQLKEEFKAVLDNTDYFSVYAKIRISATAAIYFDNFSLANEFKIRHGECPTLKNVMLSAACVEIDMLQKYRDAEFEEFISTYTLGRETFAALDGGVGEARLFSLFETYRAQARLFSKAFDLVIADKSIAEKFHDMSIAEVERQYVHLIDKAYERGDSFTSAALKLKYAKGVVEIKNNYGSKVLSLLKEVAEEAKAYTSHEVLESLRFDIGHKEFRYGDKNKGLEIIQSEFDSKKFDNDEQKFWATLELYRYYDLLNKLDKLRSLDQELIELLEKILAKGLTLEELEEYNRNLSDKHHYEIAWKVILKIESLKEVNANASLSFINSIVYFLSSHSTFYAIMTNEYQSENIEFDIGVRFEFVKWLTLKAEELAIGMESSLFDKRKFDDDILKIKSRLRLVESNEPSDKEEFTKLLYDGSNLDKYMFSPTEHADVLINSWETKIKDGASRRNVFNSQLSTVVAYLNETFNPFQFAISNDEGEPAFRQQLFLPISLEDEEVELVKAAVKILKFIKTKNKGTADFKNSHLELLHLNYGALASQVLKNEDYLAFFLDEAFEKLEDPNYTLDFYLEKEWKLQLVFMKVKFLARNCHYIDALQVLKQYESFLNERDLPYSSAEKHVFGYHERCNAES